MSVLPRRYFTQEEYLKLEDLAEIRSQYVGGELFSMDGEQPWHIEITGNLLGMLHHRFRPRRDCHVYTGQMRVRVEAGELLTYPDLAALRGAPRYERMTNSVNLLNPLSIFEVSSPYTEEFDKGEKFARYQKLESLTDYVLVAAERMSVEHFVRQADGSWRFTEYHQPEDRLLLASMEAELPLKEIYERVVFPEAGFGG